MERGEAVAFRFKYKKLKDYLTKSHEKSQSNVYSFKFH